MAGVYDIPGGQPSGNVFSRNVYDVPAYLTYLTPAAPTVANRVPAPGANSVAEASDISFDIISGASGADVTSLNVNITEGAGSPVAVIVAGVFQTGWNGTNSAITPSGGDIAVVIDKTTDLVTDDVVLLELEVDDLSGPTLTTSWSFTTQDIDVLDSPLELERLGNGAVSLSGTITAGTYKVYVGPNGDATDPQAFNGIPGSGGEAITLTTVTGVQTTGTMYLPQLPVGGPYSIYLVPIGAGSPITVTNAVTVYPNSFGSKTLSLRRLLPNYYNVGAKRHDQERFPQE